MCRSTGRYLRCRKGENISIQAAEGLTTKEEIKFSETREDGRKFFEVVVTSIHNVDHGSIIGLMCLPSNEGAHKNACAEFPLFLNSLAASPVQVAIEKGGLPAALEALDRLHEHDLQKIYVSSFEDTSSGGEFLVVDEKSGEEKHILSTFPQAVAVAIRYRQPMMIERNALLSANADFVDRMVLNPAARDLEGDLELLVELSRRMRALPVKEMQMKANLAEAVSAEKYEDAAILKKALATQRVANDHELLAILTNLRTFYLHRMNIFFKL